MFISSGKLIKNHPKASACQGLPVARQTFQRLSEELQISSSEALRIRHEEAEHLVTSGRATRYGENQWRACLQCEARKIAKLVYNSNN
jgi:hypothetical protein